MMDQNEQLKQAIKALRDIKAVLSPIVERIWKDYDGYVGDIPSPFEQILTCYWTADKALKTIEPMPEITSGGMLRYK